MKFPKFSKYQIVAIVLILAIAVLLRLIDLNSLPVFADEAIYVRWSQVMRAEPTLRFLPLSDGKQPLFMWIVIPFQKLISDPVIAGRIVSVLSGLATVVGTGVLAYVLFSSLNLAIVAGLFYALSPFTVFFDRMALADPMLSMFGVWFVVTSILAVKLQRLDLAMISGFLLGGAFLTKSPALFFVILLPTTILFAQFPKKSEGRAKYIAKTTLRWGVTIAIGYGFYNILRLGPNFHMIALRNQDYVYPITKIIESPLDPFKPYFHRNFQYLMILGNYFLVFLSVVGLVNFKKHWKSTLFALTWFIIPVAIVSEFSKTMTARYIYFSLPYFMILAASSYLIFKGKLTRVFYVLLIGFIVTALYQNYLTVFETESANLPRSERFGYLEEWTSGIGIKEAAEIIRSQYNSDPQTKIVVGTEGYFGTLPDGLQAYLNDLPEITVVGMGLNFEEIPQSLIESKEAGNKTYFVVNGSRLKLDPEDFGLEIITSYTKAERPEGLWERVSFGPRDKLLLMEVTEEALLQQENRQTQE